ncbi:hypothetical protein [Atopobium sp. oral taxon 416]|uniref:hypothetical protein n=1 Tax=Atopobium sp. oral taxon 416 TaxID=712157 RepID=UPI002010D17F|nr:hypothetical protein [Atopobium sp. oral taxon 416]
MRARAGEYDTEYSNVNDAIVRMTPCSTSCRRSGRARSPTPTPIASTSCARASGTIRDLIHEIAEALRTTASSLEETGQGIASQFRG